MEIVQILQLANKKWINVQELLNGTQFCFVCFLLLPNKSKEKFYSSGCFLVIIPIKFLKDFQDNGY